MPLLTLACGIWIVLALPVFVVSLTHWDPVGRTGGKGVGRRIGRRQAWVLIEAVALLTFPLIYILSGNPHIVGTIAVGLWLAHFAHRTFVWPFLVQTRHATAPLAMVAAGVAFHLVNGGLLGWFMGFAADYPGDWLADPRFPIGVALMLGGAALNVWADYRLAQLRKANPERPVMPRGGAFEYVACPNFAGEIVEWIGFAVLTWSLPGLAMAVWTVSNLVPRALWRRTQYTGSFADYPPGRTALFPRVL